MDHDDPSLARQFRSPDVVPDLAMLPLHSTDLLTLLSPDGVVRYESPSIERLYGFEQEELVGEQVAEYFHPDDRERVVAAFEAIVESDDHRIESVEYRHLQADGSYRWIESVGSSFATPDGNYVVNSRDISERKRRERELERARAQTRVERDEKEAIRQLLLDTSTDEGLADGVCRLLVGDGGYDAAWVVTNEDGDGSGRDDVRTLAVRGDDRRVRDLAAEGSSVDPITDRVLVTNESVTLRVATGGGDSSTEGVDDGFVDRLADRGLHDVRSVPLTHDGVCYGALTVSRTDADRGYPSDLLSELAEAIAFKIRVHRQRDALVEDAIVELELGLTDGHFLADRSLWTALPEEARLTASELEAGDGETRTYLVRAADVDAETLRAALDGVEATTDVAVVADDASPVVRARVEPPTVGTVLAEHGALVQKMAVRDGHVELTVRAPGRTRLGAVVEALQRHWPDATVRSRRELSPDDERLVPFEDLTAKQAEALRAATVAGFFERPQGASADDVAETLGVSRSTFLHHLRAAEQKVFGEAFRPDHDVR